MTATHVSELAIDRMLAGELAAIDAAALRDHAASCARCGAALDDALAFRQLPLPALALPRARWLRFAPVAASVAAAAAAVLVVLTWPRAEPDGDQVRTKGSSIAGFFVAHGDAVRRGAQTETVMPGDRIEFTTTTTEPAWFAAISSDGSVYVAPTRVEPGRDRVLPAAVELDDALGSEVVTGVFCAEAFDAKAPPADCTRDHFTLVKVPR
jgi:hypothetical protein